MKIEPDWSRRPGRICAVFSALALRCSSANRASQFIQKGDARAIPFRRQQKEIEADGRIREVLLQPCADERSR
jgi:hypothetical protein